MERDNKKARDDARREYIETIRVCDKTLHLIFSSVPNSLQSLVKFIRKRDPRYKKHLETQANPPPTVILKSPSAADKQKTLGVYVEQEWQKVDTSRSHADLDWAVAEGDDLEEWDCVVCQKTFRSEAAWNSHERSKKHIKELEMLKREMEKDDVELDLDRHGMTEDVSTESIAVEDEHVSEMAPPKSEVARLSETVGASKVLTEEPKHGEKSRTDQNKVQQAVDSKATSDEEASIPTGGTDDQGESTFSRPSKRENRRARQAKKAELEERNGAGVCDFLQYLDSIGPTSSQHRCNVCNEIFPSRTKLFNHITDEGHAMAASSADTKPHKRKQKKR